MDRQKVVERELLNTPALTAIITGEAGKLGMDHFMEQIANLHQEVRDVLITRNKQYNLVAPTEIEVEFSDWGDIDPQYYLRFFRAETDEEVAARQECERKKKNKAIEKLKAMAKGLGVEVEIKFTKE
jgi:hypothetical protein